MKKIYSLLLFIFLFQISWAQPGIMSINQDVSGNYTNTNLVPKGGVFQARFQESTGQPTGIRNWQFNSDGYSNTWGTINSQKTLAGFNTTILPNGITASANWVGGGGYNAFGKLPATTTGYYYTYNISVGTGYASQFMSILETIYNPVVISTVSDVAGTNGARNVTITTAATPASGETVFLRYTTNSYVGSSLIQASGTGTSWMVTIPAQSANVSYYAFTSNKTLSQINADVTANGQGAYDTSLLNLNNNTGANYSYTVTTGNVIVYSTNIGSGNTGTSYATLAAAITAINGATHTGTITCVLASGYTETAPLGGYSITKNGTSGAPITFIKGGTSANPTFTAPAQTAGSLNDAIFKIVGGDYITFDGLTFQERSITSPSAADIAANTNTMTEFGVALFYNTITDGAQNNTIKNCTITLNRTYTNTFGIYSSTRHAPNTIATATTAAEPTLATGSNSNNKFYTNAISNVNYGMVFIGSTTAAAMDSGNDIGGSSLSTGNTITNCGGGASVSAAGAFINLTGNNYMIFLNHQINDNISYNTITSSALTSSVTEGGILKNYSATQPTGTITTTINNNTITITNAPSLATSGAVIGINNQGLTPLLSTATMSINNNIIQNCTVSGATSTTNGITGITNLSLPGTLNITGNSVIGNAITATSATSGTNLGISNSGAGGTVNLNNNIIRNLASTCTSGQIQGIINTGAVVTALNINSNQFGNSTGGFFSTSTATSGTLFGISTSAGAATCALSITGNDIRGVTYSTAASAPQTYIINSAATLSQNISSNTFTNLNVNTTGDVSFISNNVTLSTGGFLTANSNSIVTGFNKTGAGGTVTLFLTTSGPSSVAGTTKTAQNNNFSNITVTGATTINGWMDIEGLSSGSTKNISNNTFSNWTCGSSAVTALQVGYSVGSSTVNTNTISNITGTGAITGISLLSTNVALAVNSNTISGLSSTGTGGAVTGISSAITTTGNIYSNIINTLSSSSTSAAVAGISSSGATTNIYSNTINTLSSASTTTTVTGISSSGATANIYSNIINALSSASTSATVAGISSSGATANNIYSNTINTLSCVGGTTTGVTNGIMLTAGITNNVYKNKIYDLSVSGATTTSGVVNGIVLSGSTSASTSKVYNNIIGDLKAPTANVADAIRAISVTATGTTSTHNVQFNTIYLTATSSGATFGTTGLYHVHSATGTTARLVMNNNLIVNNSTPSGTGQSVAFRRSAASVASDNYQSGTSNNNSFYAGIPSALNLIYSDGTNSDQTITALKTRFTTAGRESASVTVNATSIFTSTTTSNVNYLKINAGVTTPLESGGVAISGITDDYWSGTRPFTSPTNGGTGVDIGASEFDGIKATPTVNNLAIAVTGSPSLTGNQCTNVGRTVSANVIPVNPLSANPILNYQVAGGSVQTVSMTATTTSATGATGLTAGTLTTTGYWTATIPTVSPTNATVTWNITATDGTLTGATTGIAYTDNPTNGLIGTAAATVSTVCIGASTSLSAVFGSTGSVSLGAGASTSSSASTGSMFSGTYGGEKSQYIIKASELTALGLTAGNITSLAFEATTAFAGYEGFALNIGHTAVSVAAIPMINTGLTQVYSGTGTNNQYSTSIGVNTLTFTTPFTWDGVQNIVVSFCWAKNPTATSTTSTTVKVDSPGFTCTSYGQKDSTLAATMCLSIASTDFGTTGTGTARPKFIFSGNTAPTPTAYSWSDGSTVVGTTNPLVLNPTATKTYTCTATISSCPVVSSGVSVTVNPLPTAPTATNSSQCGQGVPTASVGDPNLFTTPTFKWYAASTGGTASQSSTSTTYTTSISATTTLYVSVVNPTTTCESARTAITVTVSSAPTLTLDTATATICNGVYRAISVTSGTVGSYSSFTWSASTPANLYSDTAGTVYNVGTVGVGATTVYVKATTSGSNTVTLTASNVNNCSAVTTSTITVMPLATITSSGNNYCLSGSPTLTLSPSTGYGQGTIQWASSTNGSTYTDVVGQTAATYSPGAVTTTTYYKARILNGAGSECTTSPTITITVNNPSITDYSGAGGSLPAVSICGTGSATLTAVPNSGSTLKWYTASTGGTALTTTGNITISGNTLTNGALAATTNYYAESSVGASTEISGRLTPVSTTGYLTTAWGVLFNVTTAGTLNSTVIYPVGTGTVTLALYNSSGTELQSTAAIAITGSGIATPVTITLGFTVPLGNGYRLLLKAYTGITDLLRDGTNSFPYSSTNTSVTGGWSGSSSTSYYWFYNLNFSFGCIATRQIVTATVTTPPSLSLSSSSQTICSGSNSSLITLTGGSSYNTFVWSPSTNVSGSAAAGYVFNPTVTTTYTLTASQTSGSLCKNTAKFTCTVNPAPSVLDITNADAVVCMHKMQTITATGGALPASASVILNETFNGSAPGWLVTNATTGGTPLLAAWGLTPDGYVYSNYATWHSNDNSQSIMTNSDAAGSGSTTKTTLISPSFSTTDFTAATINFYSYLYDTAPASTTAKVQASLDNLTWTDLLTLTPSTSNTATTFALSTITLPAGFLNQPAVYIRFNYSCTFRFFWGVDNVTISGTRNMQPIVWSAINASLYNDAAGTSEYNPPPGSYQSTIYALTIGNNAVITATAALGSCSKTDSVTFTTGISTYTAGGWSPSVPTGNTELAINADYNGPTGDLSACSCTVASTGVSQVTVKSGDTWSLVNELNTNNVPFTFENNSSLLQENPLAINTGNVKYLRNTSILVNDLDVVYWSSPVAAQQIRRMWMTVDNDTYFKFNASINPQDWVYASPSSYAIPGEGYIARAKAGTSHANTDGASSWSIGTPWTAPFIGVPNNGDSYSITVYAGSNLLGNPYPSAINLDTFTDDNSTKLNGLYYFWEHNSIITANGYTINDYGSYVRSTGISLNATTNLTPAVIPRRYIATGQSFFADTSTSGTVTFKNTERVAGNNSNFYKFASSSPIINGGYVESHNLWLNLESVNFLGISKQQLVGYAQGATNGFDAKYDAETYAGNSFIDFYSVLTNKKFMQQSRDFNFTNTDIVPIGFVVSNADSYTLSIDNSGNHAASWYTGQKVYLQDNLLGILHDLTAGSYTFSTLAGTFDNRFELRYVSTALATNSPLAIENTVIVYKDKNVLKIKSSVEDIKQVTIYDLVGRKIYDKDNLSTKAFVEQNIVNNNQTLIVKISLANGVIVSKKVLF